MIQMGGSNLDKIGGFTPPDFKTDHKVQQSEQPSTGSRTSSSQTLQRKGLLWKSYACISIWEAGGPGKQFLFIPFVHGLFEGPGMDQWCGVKRPGLNPELQVIGFQQECQE